MENIAKEINTFCHEVGLQAEKLRVLTCYSGYMDERRPPYYFSDNTLARVQNCARLMRTGDFDVVVVSGSFVHPRDRGYETDAELMRDYLINEAGIDPRRIMVDNRAIDSYENVDNTLAILNQLLVELGIDQYELTMSGTWGQAQRSRMIFADRGVKVTVSYIPFRKSWREGIIGIFVILFTFIDRKGKSWMVAFIKARRRKKINSIKN